MRREPKILFLCLALSGLAFRGTARATEVKPSQFSLSEIYQGATATRKLLESLRVRYSYTTKAVGGDLPLGSRVAIGTWRRTYAYKGQQRFSAEARDATPTADAVDSPTYVFDGETGFVHSPGSLMMFAGKAQNTEKADYYCEEVLDIPVTDEARASYDNSWMFPHCIRTGHAARNFEDFVVLPEQEQVDGVWCHVVDCAGSQKLWVDPQIGFGLRRKEMYKPGRQFLAEYSYTEFIEPVAGVWLPKRCMRLTNPFGSGDMKLETAVSVVEVVVNEQVVDADFDLEVPPGTIVLGKGIGFVVQGDKTTLLDMVANGLAVPKNNSGTWWKWVAANSLLAAVLLVIFWRWWTRRAGSVEVTPAE